MNGGQDRPVHCSNTYGSNFKTYALDIIEGWWASNPMILFSSPQNIWGSHEPRTGYHGLDDGSWVLGTIDVVHQSSQFSPDGFVPDRQEMEHVGQSRSVAHTYGGISMTMLVCLT